MSDAKDPRAEEALGRAYDGRLMRRLLGYLAPYRKHALGALALMVVSSAGQLFGPVATAVAFDLFLVPASGGGEGARRSGISTAVADWLARSGHHPGPVEGLAVIAALWAAVLALTFVLLWAQGYLLQTMGQRVLADLRRDVFARLQELDVAFFDRTPVGRLVVRVTTDIDSLNELFTAGIVSIVGDLLLLGGIAAVLFALDWRLALAAFSILPLLLALTLWFKTRARTSFREVRVEVARLAGFLQEHVAGMPVVQLFGREARALEEFRAINRAHRDANIRGIHYYAVYYPGVEILTAIGLGLILAVGGSRALGGALSAGALVAFLQYAQRFYQPLADLSEKYNVLQQAMASSERIFQLLDTPVSVTSPPGGHAPARVEGAIEFERVDFSYRPGERVLHEVSFRVEPGEMVAVVGATGAGKSTLANLLLRFYDVEAGAVRLDGVDVREWGLGALRRAVGLVLQDVFLFAGTVAENLRLGEVAFEEERLRTAARDAEALDFVERLPGGLEAPVRERGAGLSVGQKQLLAFARALVFDPPVLVLDEATASVDTETERRIQAALERLLAGRTSLVIAHRLSTVQRADRILVLHHGRLVEQGSHRELLAGGGLYRRLHELQSRDAGRAAGG
ncbi:MAG: ABC transporter ATP-binding protein [Thermoanaerobaculia bacterium]|nr:MAG: ABC transporter ATP-binding protein [Thermoanaerobaculia bacterium]